MNSKADARAGKTARTRETIVDFDAARLSAPFSLRCGALLIDYILVLLAPVLMMLFGRYLGNDGTRLVGGNLSDTGWLIAIIIAASNFILLPMLSGQSVGKMATGLRVVRADGRDAGFMNILLRNVPGYLLTAVTLGLGFILSVFSNSGRALHDYLGGTVVVYADRKFR